MLPADMRTTSGNPLFSSNAPDVYAQKYYQQAIQPLVDQERISQAQRGMGAGESTFGTTAITNLQSQGANQAFFAGRDYLNQEVNNLLNRRASFFGNEARIPQEQNANDVQRSLGLGSLENQGLGMLNQFNLGSAGALGNLYQTQTQNRLQAQQNSAANLGNLIGGVAGLGGGLLNAYMGRSRSSGGGTPTASNTPTTSWF